MESFDVLNIEQLLHIVLNHNHLQNIQKRPYFDIYILQWNYF